MTRSTLLARFQTVRRRSLHLTAPLTAEDCQAQSMPDASPVKWHLAHTTWFFETFILERHEPSFRPFNPSFRALFNSYYDAVGERHARPERGLLTRPSLAEVLAWRAEVEARIERLYAEQASPELAFLLELGLQHEQQHQELILTDVKHLFSRSALLTAYRPESAKALLEQGQSGLSPLRWVECAGDLHEIGHAGEGFAFDNETPRHKIWLEPFAIADRLVTQGEWAEFIAAGGYQEPRWWLSEGWAWREAHQTEAPLYWLGQRADDPVFTLAGPLVLAAHYPVVHVSYYEADAYARWRAATDPACAGARLPTEAEWEAAAAQHAAQPTTMASEDPIAIHPLPAEHAAGVLGQMFDVCWQWTASSYAAYPGYRPWPGGVGEYNGKFMVNQYVLRGASVATPASHRRLTYRNFFPASARWQFSGVRLARSLG